MVAYVGADMGADKVVVVARAREVVRLDGSGTHGGPWGTNVEYLWVEVDAEGNEVAASARTEGLSDEIERKASFTAPVLTEERVLHYRLTVTGQGAAMRGAVNRHRASATVQVTVRAGPALIGVEVTSELQDYEIYGIDATIEATASFGEAVEVTGAPVLALDLGGVAREATFVRGNGSGTGGRIGATDLVFTYTVKDTDPEAGIGFPENPVSLPAGSVIRTVEAPMAVGLRLAATPPVVRIDGVRPALDGMELPEVLGLALKLIYHEALDEDSVPAAGAYTVTATSETVPANLPVTAVAVKGNTVTLTLARAPGVSQMVTMTYNAPASNPVRDLAGNKAGALTESQKVKSVPTVSVGAVYPKVAPGPGRCGVPGDGVAGAGVGSRGHAVVRAGGRVYRGDHGHDHDSGGPDLGDPDVRHCQRLHPRVRRSDRDDRRRRGRLRDSAGAGQRGDGAGGGGEPAVHREVGQERLHGDRGRGRGGHGDAAHRRGRAEAAQ